MHRVRKKTKSGNKEEGGKGGHRFSKKSKTRSESKKGRMRREKGKGDGHKEGKGKEKAELLTGCSPLFTQFEFSKSESLSL